jgi:hypothetical protein
MLILSKAVAVVNSCACFLSSVSLGVCPCLSPFHSFQCSDSESHTHWINSHVYQIC